jgi:hypothetical protein
MQKITPCLWFDGKAEEAHSTLLSLRAKRSNDSVWSSESAPTFLPARPFHSPSYLARNAFACASSGRSVSALSHCTTSSV